MPTPPTAPAGYDYGALDVQHAVDHLVQVIRGQPGGREHRDAMATWAVICLCGPTAMDLPVVVGDRDPVVSAQLHVDAAKAAVEVAHGEKGLARQHVDPLGLIKVRGRRMILAIRAAVRRKGRQEALAAAYPVLQDIFREVKELMDGSQGESGGRLRPPA